MKLFSRCLVPALCLLATTAHAIETDHLQGLGDTRYHNIQSATLGREFHVYVMLPDGYSRKSRETYPTIYLLDGGALFPMLVGYYRYLQFGGELPEAIIVGISYGANDYENGNLRSTDYTAPSSERSYYGGAAKFQGFLKRQLIPLIEDEYRSRADRRIIFGQSIGGQFVLYTAQTDPALFWGHIASNPALHRNLDYFLAQSPESISNSRLFVANGTRNDSRFQEPASKWIEHWSKVTHPPWKLQTMDLQDHTHMSTPPAAFRQGMNWLFADNTPDDD
jgi:predicted alpha/beta superfamily hydrolase